MAVTSAIGASRSGSLKTIFQAAFILQSLKIFQLMALHRLQTNKETYQKDFEGVGGLWWVP